MNEKRNAFREQIAGKRVTLLGMGVSNRAAMEFLLRCGAELTVRDQNPTPNEELAAALAERGIEAHFGEDYLCGIEADMILRSPGIRADTPALSAARERGCVVTSEIELFVSLCPCRIFAVTGSDGKTTTTTIIAEMLKKAAARSGSRVFVGGNIGSPLLPLIDEIGENDDVVLELSSFQLSTMSFSPYAAVVTNVSPNHLNWHTSMEEYIDCKRNIFRGQSGDARLILNADNAITADMASDADAKVVFFSAKGAPAAKRGCFYEGDAIYYLDGTRTLVMKRSEIRIAGMHNVENYMAAISAVWGIVTPDEMREVARAFAGVRHRIELVTERDGVRYFNSSIDTSPTRTMAALSSFDEPLIVIVGGYDKHIPVEPMLPMLAEKAKYVVGTGKTGWEILRKLAVFGYSTAQTRYLPNFDNAVKYAMSIAKRGDTVLLSPAAASFDAFPNFEVRGDRFCTLVTT